MELFQKSGSSGMDLRSRMDSASNPCGLSCHVIRRGLQLAPATVRSSSENGSGALRTKRWPSPRSSSGDFPLVSTRRLQFSIGGLISSIQPHCGGQSSGSKFDSSTAPECSSSIWSHPPDVRQQHPQQETCYGSDLTFPNQPSIHTGAAAFTIRRRAFRN